MSFMRVNQETKEVYSVGDIVADLEQIEEEPGRVALVVTGFGQDLPNLVDVATVMSSMPAAIKMAAAAAKL